MKTLLKNYTFSTSGKTITCTDVSTVRLDRLLLIVDVTTNKILYNFADSTVTAATVATNVITLAALQGGENNTDKLQIVYDTLTSDTAFGDTTEAIQILSSVLPTGASTAAKQPAIGTAGTPSADIITVQGATSMTALKTDGSAVTQPVSGTLTANAGTNLNTSALALETGGNLATTATNTGTLAGAVTSSVVQENVKQINGVTPLMGNGVTGTGSQRVTIASDNTAFAVNATLSAETTKVIGVTRTADGAGNLLTSTGNALDVNLKTPATLAANMTQLNGVATSVGNGTTDTGTQRVSISSDSTGQVNITDGTNKANILKSDGTAAGQNSQLVAPTGLNVTGLTAGSLNADLIPSVDVSNYRYGAVTITGTWVGTLTYQGSIDNSTFFTINTMSTSGSTSGFSTGTTTINGTQQFPIFFKYLRVRMTSYTSGTANGVVQYLTLPPISNSGAIAQQGTWTVGANSATGSAVPANAFYQGVSDGTNLRGVLGAANALNTTGNGIPTAQVVGQFDDVSPTAITENQFGNLRMSANRNAYTTIRDAAGNERGANVDSNSNLQIGQATAANLNATVVGTGTFSVQTTSDTPGTGATNLGKAEDAAAASGDTGVMVLGVRNDTLTAAQTSANGDYGAASIDTSGILITAGAPRALKGRQATTITSSTAETTILTAVTSTFLDVYGLILTNTSATVTKVSVRDATAGGTVTVLEVPPTDTRGFMLPIDSAIPQATVNNNWTAQCGTSVSALEVTVLYVKRV